MHNRKQVLTYQQRCCGDTCRVLQACFACAVRATAGASPLRACTAMEHTAGGWFSAIHAKQRAVMSDNVLGIACPQESGKHIVSGFALWYMCGSV